MSIFTQLTKPISEYENIGPHVAVAKQLTERGVEVHPGTIIQYIICTGGQQIRDRARLPEDCEQKDYDADYYVNNQIIPAVEKIFEVMGYSKEDLVASFDQKKLDKFF